MRVKYMAPVQDCVSHGLVGALRSTRGAKYTPAEYRIAQMGLRPPAEDLVLLRHGVINFQIALVGIDASAGLIEEVVPHRHTVNLRQRVVLRKIRKEIVGHGTNSQRGISG